MNQINEKISEHNQKIQNSKKEKDKIKEIFWKIMRFENDNIIESYEKEKKNWNHEKRKKMKK